MNIYEWKQKQLQKKNHLYTHLDRKISLKKCFDYITSPDRISHHGFYPFIHYTIINRKIKKDSQSKKCKKDNHKKREIYYASHIDSWIYKYYAYLINEAYNKRVEKDGINSVAVAYRTNLYKNNIDFAKDAFTYIKNTSSCHIMIGDFTSFFDNLDHIYLKNQLCNLLSTESLPSDFYAIYKNITKFSYIELQDLLAFHCIKDTPNGRKNFNSLLYDRALSPEQFRKNKFLVKTPSNKNCGIPQGSPISAVLANVYMLTADKKIYDYIHAYNGLYMRYSDDFIIAIPQSNITFSEHYRAIKEILDSIPQLKLEDSKTKIFTFSDLSIKNCTDNFISYTNNYTKTKNNKKNILEFLGFSFDGKFVRIRDKTISKYYNKLYRKLCTIIKNNGFTYKHNRISGKNLYDRYSYKGSIYYKKRKYKHTISNNDTKQTPKINTEQGNFIDYVIRAQKKFINDPIDIINKRHMQKIRKVLQTIK